MKFRKTKESKPLTEGEDDEKVDIEMVQDQPPDTLFKVRGRKTAVKDKRYRYYSTIHSLKWSLIGSFHIVICDQIYFRGKVMVITLT